MIYKPLRRNNILLIISAFLVFTVRKKKNTRKLSYAKLHLLRIRKIREVKELQTTNITHRGVLSNTC